ncbi:hypothetical protein LX36DRAFT_653757 [Colletotrichum falcatum]|nr:hypothetical protein LX36DRAFT_653757 [Colletotrichum falcatum]
MQFSVALVALFASAAIAAPAGGEAVARTTYDPCSGLYDTPLCCATDVLGLANLDCHPPSAVPNSANNFKEVCASGGQRARCCVLPVIGLGVLCQTPAGVTY